MSKLMKMHIFKLISDCVLLVGKFSKTTAVEVVFYLSSDRGSKLEVRIRTFIYIFVKERVRNYGFSYVYNRALLNCRIILNISL